MERNLDHVSVIQLNLIVAQCVEESIKRLLEPGFHIFDNLNDLVNRRLVQQTAWSIDEQANVFEELNIRGKFQYFVNKLTGAN